MQEKMTQQEDRQSMDDVGPISWWSWRPGMAPGKALLTGAVFTIVALVLAGIGLVTLVLGILDGVSPPVLLAGIVTGHSTGMIDNLPHLTIHLHTQGFPDEIMPPVPASASRNIHDGDQVLVDYSPRLHFLYALDSNKQHYLIPSSSAFGNPFGSFALLFLGSVLFPYPALLSLWAWRDLNIGRGSRKKLQMTARITDLRAATSSGTRRTGLMPVPSRSWYGVALWPTTTDPAISRRVIPFSISERTYALLHEGDTVHITYSPNLHHVYSIYTVSADTVKAVEEEQ